MRESAKLASAIAANACSYDMRAMRHALMLM